MQKTTQKLHSFRKIWSIVGWAAILLAVGCMIGLLVCIVMLGIEVGDLRLVGALCGGFAGGIVLFGGLAFLALRRSEVYEDKERDALELEDGENSFFIGEGTLATFEESSLRIHGGTGKNQIVVPYTEMRFFSVCSRRAPKEKGDWSVVMEIPAHFLAKKGKANKADPPVLVQTAAKERLYRCLESRGLTLLGERPKEEKQAQPFERVAKFELPNTAKRRKSLIFIVTGVVFFAVGVGLMFKWATIGAVVGVVGLYVASRAVISFLKAKAVFAVYKEGIFYREPSGADNVFLKWEEVSQFSLIQAQGAQYLRAQCVYGAYDFPAIGGAYDYIKEHYPEKA